MGETNNDNEKTGIDPWIIHHYEFFGYVKGKLEELTAKEDDLKTILALADEVVELMERFNLLPSKVAVGYIAEKEKNLVIEAVKKYKQAKDGGAV